MNGRIYDPVLGRFLSADPVIASPLFTQSYNSYSYCVNNPLRYFDPTGYNAVDDFVAGMVANGYNHWNSSTRYSTLSQFDLLANTIGYFEQFGWESLFSYLGICSGGGGGSAVGLFAAYNSSSVKGVSKNNNYTRNEYFRDNIY